MRAPATCLLPFVVPFVVVAALAQQVPAPGVPEPTAPEQSAPPPPAQEPQAPDPAPARPKLALVLSGGGARGAAHIGVLKVLEELRIRPDIVVGTSMGSIVGGLYAAGWSPQEIETLLAEIDWDEMFRDRLYRPEQSFRRKQDDEPFLVQTKIRFKGLKPYIPGGALAGQSLELMLLSLEMQSTTEQDFDRLPIPFRAVAMDIVTGEPVVIGSGSLAAAMRASMSIPGAFPPVVLNGRTLVDGGAAANLPVGLAQQMGFDRVIAVDISSRLSRTGDAPDSFLAVYMQLNSIMTAANRVEDIKRLRAGDVLIVPDLGDVSFVDFDRAGETVAIGTDAARAKADELRPLAADEARWREFEARHRKPALLAPVIDEVRLVNTSPIADEVILAHLGLRAGDPLDDKVLRARLLTLYNLSYFGIIRDRVETVDGRQVLVIETPARPYGRNVAQFGLNFRDDFEGDSAYNLTIRHQFLAVNRRGGEWQNVLQIGDRALVSSAFYQPLDLRMRWFVEPALRYERFQQPVWFEAEPVAEYLLQDIGAHLDVGYVLGNWGELRMGPFYSRNRATLRTGLPIFPTFDDDLAGVGAQFRVDTRDSTVFPTRGWNVHASYGKSVESLGSDAAFDQVTLSAEYSIPLGASTVAPYVEASFNAERPTPFTSVNLGGLGRLSGLGLNELAGEDLVFGRLRYQYRLASIDAAGIRMRLYVGATLEAGNVYEEGASITADSLRTGYSAYFAAETPVGPVYLGYGRTDGGRDRVYFLIGDSY